MRRAICEKRNLIILWYKEAYMYLFNLNSSFSNFIFSILQDYEDVFLEETIKGLSPLYKMKHQINFIPGTSILNSQPTKVILRIQKNFDGKWRSF